MGGDFAPVNEVLGAILAAEEFDAGASVEIVFVGQEEKIRQQLSKHSHKNLQYSIVHADEIVTMEDEPSSVIKKKKNSSLYKGIELHRNNEVDAFVSAGNTGAVMSTATLVLGRIKNVSRPTIGAFLPTQSSHPTLLLDVGANVDSKPRHLYEFAIMGSIYATQILRIHEPKVGLLNVGEESVKGTETVQQAYQMLSEQNIVNFIGNVEGRDILMGTANVVVCDGFEGNIVLKFAESMMGLLRAKIKAYSQRGIIEKISVALMVPTMKKILREFDYQEYGGVPLLGVNGVVIIGHGKSSPKAIKNMLLRAAEVIRHEVNSKIEQTLSTAISEVTER